MLHILTTICIHCGKVVYLGPGYCLLCGSVLGSREVPVEVEEEKEVEKAMAA